MAVVRAVAGPHCLVVQPVLRPSRCSTDEYCCCVMLLLVAGCVVCGACPSALLCAVGCPLSAPPSSWWWVGALWLVGGVLWMVGGMAMEGRWRQWLPLLSLPSSPSACWCPPFVCPVVLLNGGAGVCCDVPVFGLGSARSRYPVPSYHPRFSSALCVVA